MKLFHSPTSPYVRKVMVCAIVRDLDSRIELIPTSAHDCPPALLAANPLSKVPCLLTDDGVALFDSPVICEYLDSLEDGGAPLFPRAHGARWRALKFQALADGVLDAAIMCRAEMARPQDAAHDAFLAKQWGKVQRGLDQLDRDPPSKVLDIGAIAVACALGYLDFRLGDKPWRPARPNLAAWADSVASQPAFQRTLPKAP